MSRKNGKTMSHISERATKSRMSPQMDKSFHTSHPYDLNSSYEEPNHFYSLIQMNSNHVRFVAIMSKSISQGKLLY